MKSRTKQNLGIFLRVEKRDILMVKIFHIMVIHLVGLEYGQLLVAVAVDLLVLVGMVQ